MELRVMKWIDSRGGPLILLASNQLLHWNGIDGDYDRACAVDGWIGVLSVGAGQALVLNDEPLSTTQWLVAGRQLLVCCGYARDELSVAQHLERAGTLDFPHPSTVVDFGHRSVVLFDAVVTGSELDDEEVLRMKLPNQRCEVRTLDWKPDEETWLILHSLEPVE